MRHKLLFSLFSFLIVTLSAHSKQKDFVLNARQTVTVACSNSEEQVVHTALDMLTCDIRTVLSSTTQASESTGMIVVGRSGGATSSTNRGGCFRLERKTTGFSVDCVSGRKTGGSR